MAWRGDRAVDLSLIAEVLAPTKRVSAVAVMNIRLIPRKRPVVVSSRRYAV